MKLTKRTYVRNNEKIFIFHQNYTAIRHEAFRNSVDGICRKTLPRIAERTAKSTFTLVADIVEHTAKFYIKSRLEWLHEGILYVILLYSYVLWRIMFGF